ncbi:MAG: transposase [Chloroflexota bacterium]
MATSLQRRSIRLKDYDYSQSGAYFVTICTYRQSCLFGVVAAGQVRLNEYGRIAHTEWLKSAEIRQEIALDVFVVMPNHIHGIVWITSPDRSIGNVRTHARKGDRPVALTPPRGPAPKSLGAFLAGYKSAVTKQINQVRDSPGTPVWQRNYYEHIIRTERALAAIRQYIAQNPLRWELDRYNPATTGPDPQARELWNLLQPDTT